MSLSRWWERYYDNTGKASDLSRQLAFAGIAMIWIFSGSSGDNIKLTTELLWPSLLLILTLAFDFLQYFSSALVWYFFTKYQEKSLGVNCRDDLPNPEWVNYPGQFFFWSKCILLLIGYAMLGFYVWALIKGSI